MDRTTRRLIGIVAVLHGLFFVAELFFWETLTPLIGLYDPQSVAAKGAPGLAALAVSLGRNTGLYNGIVAGAFGWLLSTGDLSPRSSRSLATYLLSCVIIAGVFGGIMLKPTIPAFQSLPAIVALAWLWRTTGRCAEDRPRSSIGIAI